MIDAILEDFIEELVELELASEEEPLPEANAAGSGAVVGYTGPLGMDTEPGHKMLWSGDDQGSDRPSQKENVLDAMQQKHVGGANRKKPYGDTYVGFSSGKEEDESGRDKQTKIVKKVNKNLDKKPYTLHDPPSMGISISRPSLQDRPAHPKKK